MQLKGTLLFLATIVIVPGTLAAAGFWATYPEGAPIPPWSMAVIGALIWLAVLLVLIKLPDKY